MVALLKKIVRAYLLRRSFQLGRRYPGYRFGRGTYASRLKIHSWNEGSTLSIGAYCSIADGVQIYLGGEHNIDWVTTYPFSVLRKSASHIVGHPRTKGSVVIGNDVWIGKEAMILSGVKIGDGAVVGARALVTKAVQPYAIVAGNPAHEIGKRFDDRAIERLLEIKWWDWDANRIDKAIPLLLSSDIDAFLKAVENDAI